MASTIIVPLRAVGKERPRSHVVKLVRSEKGRLRIAGVPGKFLAVQVPHMPREYQQWCETLRLLANTLDVPQGECELFVTARFKIPKSWSKKKQAAKLGKEASGNMADVDNIGGAVMDALWPPRKRGDPKGAGKDDKRVCRITCERLWHHCDEMEITIVPLEREEPLQMFD